MPGFSRQERLGINLAQNATIPTLTTPPSSHEGKDGDKRIVASSFGKGPRMYIKSEGTWWYTEFLPTSSHPVESEKQFNTLNTRNGLGVDSGSFSMANTYHRYVSDIPIRAAKTSDNTVVTEIPGLKFPGKSCITFAAVLVQKQSNAYTISLNLQVSETTGTAVGASIASGTELIGTGGTTKADSGGSDIVGRPQNTDSNALSSSGADIQVGGGSAPVGEVYLTQVPYFHDTTNDFYAYLCNGGTSSGAIGPTTDAIDGSTDPVTFGVDVHPRFRVGEYILIDTEQLLITSVVASSIPGDVTAIRAQNSTTIASHSSGATVYTLTPSQGMVTVMFDYIGSF